ncbi:MAG: SUMF1/EgtB/PvdO family nonheme iron enzyme [Pseudomonadales bacterium]
MSQGLSGCLRRGSGLLLLFALGGCEAPPPGNTRACPLNESEIGSFVEVPGGEFTKGAAPMYPEELPTVTLHVMGFSLLAHEVTNAEFAAFVAATGYVTDAERGAASGAAEAGSAVFASPGEQARSANPWRLVAGATWRAPDGPGSDLDGRGRHPVVHVSLADARAYAAWAGGRLPTEVEWEYAAARGLPDAADARSGAYDRAGAPLANTWQGFFPFVDSATDGFAGAAPVGCFPANGFGAYDLIGNVWEWTDTAYDADGRTHAIKGGSFLCADNFCRRYRPAARQPQETDFSASHIGFRIVRDRG